MFLHVPAGPVCLCDGARSVARYLIWPYAGLKTAKLVEYVGKYQTTRSTLVQDPSNAKSYRAGGWAESDCYWKSNSGFYPKVSAMKLVITAALIFGFVICLAIGFLSVAHDLLSRLIEESPSGSIEARPEQSNHEYEHPQPIN